MFVDVLNGRDRERLGLADSNVCQMKVEGGTNHRCFRALRNTRKFVSKSISSKGYFTHTARPVKSLSAQTDRQTDGRLTLGCLQRLGIGSPRTTNINAIHTIHTLPPPLPNFVLFSFRRSNPKVKHVMRLRRFHSLSLACPVFYSSAGSDRILFLSLLVARSRLCRHMVVPPLSTLG